MTMATIPLNEVNAQQDPLKQDLTVFDLETALSEVKNHDTWKKGRRSAKTLIKDHRQRITLVLLHRGETVSSHRANGPISVQMIKGTMKFMTPLRTVLLEQGQVLTLRSGIQHSMEAPEDAAFLLTLALEGDELPHPAITTPGEAQPSRSVESSAMPTGAKADQSSGIKRITKEHFRLLPSDGKPVRTLKEYEKGGGLEGLHRALAMSPKEIVADLNRSGLRGRGGAGFPTGVKWAGVIGDGVGKRFVVCNGAEGEPGTFKDRYLLRANPYLTLEGLAIAAHAVGAERAFVCVKKSFTQEAELLRNAIEEIHRAHLFPNGRSLKIELVLGPEEYLFGEEKALMEVIEGNLPLPRWLPPYIEGLFRKPHESNPTLVNNVETLANVALALRHGPDWFRAAGTPESPGTMIFTVCGDVERPGCYELPLGTPMRQLIDQMAGGVRNGHQLKVIFSGVSNGVVTPDHLDVALDFDSMKAIGSGLGSGGFIIYDDSACIVKAAAMVSQFLYVESCGQCPPCKFSSGEITERLRKIEGGTGSSLDIETILARCTTVDQGNRCALPTGEHAVIESIVRHFPKDFQAHFSSPCPLPRDLLLPKLVDYDDQLQSFTYDERQQFKQPDWSTMKTNSFA